MTTRVFGTRAERDRDLSRYPAQDKGGIAMTAFVSQLSIVAAYAAMAFVGAIVLGVL